ncbi:MAG: Rieske 2Fe-2S domain-containing protein [Actinomycetota bacterium]|nr:Rieske 2Fe-2S domain-containing protein [Actinomycetota bacterium]
MRITFLGHAGFCVETARTIVVMDPWLSPTGAFDSAWFQFPRNHHLAAYVQEKLGDSRKERFLYVSHEHKDHFDTAFLDSLRSRDFTVVIADFRRRYLRTAFENYRCKGVVTCEDGQEVETPDGRLKLYLDDSELNRDSAILVQAGGRSFLNLNDCRIFDAVPMIAREEGPIDVFACQFSGAGWHPTCYEYPRETYEAIARKKMTAKFHSVVKGIRDLQPRAYVPSAGPPCFLDPTLFHLNFERVNIFPRAPKLLEFLGPRLRNVPTSLLELMPGDVLDAESGAVVYEAKERVDEESFERYVREYAGLYEGLFAERQRRYTGRNGGGELLEHVREALREKLEALTLHDRVETPLYFRLDDLPDRMLRVEFPAKSIEYAHAVEDGNYYSITAPSWEVARVLDRKITWDDFSLTFRMSLNREPDVYQTVVQGFLRLEPEDMNWFCAKLLNIENNQERVVVEAGGRRYVVNRYCPHQGGDLSRGWVEEGRFLTCPRHQWQFDLENEGQARKNEGTIAAVCLDDD